MKVIDRSEFNEHPEFEQLREVIVKSFQPPKHTQNILEKNKETEGFTESSRHFAQVGKKSPLFIHYDVDCSLILEKTGISMRVMSIAIYGSMGEYAKARKESLGGLN